MKKIIAQFLLLSGMVILGCDQNNLVSPQGTGAPGAGGRNPSKANPVTMGCSTVGNEGTATWLKNSSYNCHGYVRGALINHRTAANGMPNAVAAFSVGNTIQNDPNFIRVCSKSDAQALAQLPIGMDHSALVIGSTYTYATPGPGYVWVTGMPLHYGTPCDYEYYAAIPDVTITGPVKSGNNYTFTLNKANHAFITVDAGRWTCPTGFSFVGTPTDTQATITPNANTGAGTYSITASIKTSALTGSCLKGVNGIENATNYIPTRTGQVTLAPNCTGTLDGGALNTVNSVTYGTHQVVMNVYPLTWVKTSGTATWFTGDSGHTVSITLTSGSASFHVYGSGCDMNYTFFPH